jgi:hypothetical protein
MKCKWVKASWVHIPLPHDGQHTSDFGRTPFDGTLVRIDSEGGIAAAPTISSGGKS